MEKIKEKLEMTRELNGLYYLFGDFFGEFFGGFFGQFWGKKSEEREGR